MDINSLKCPNCAGKLLNINRTKKICPYCDSEFIISKTKTKNKPNSNGTISYAEIVRDICVNSNIDHYSITIGKSLKNSNKFIKAKKNFTIPDGEDAFLINDSTVFGGFRKGFAICTTGIYLCRNKSRKHYVKWEDYEDVDLRAKPPYDIFIDNIEIYVFGIAEQLHELLLEIQDSI